MFKVALATTVCYDKSCINYKKAINKDLLRNPQIRFRNKDSTGYGPTALKNKKLYEFRNEKVT
jgi:hypothetical protein